MVKHIILWQLKDELSDAEKATVKAGIKEGLEGLVGKVPGLLEVHVNINGLPTSNADVMLDTTLESFEALKGYAVHPAHVAVADGKVRPYTNTGSDDCLYLSLVRTAADGTKTYGLPMFLPLEEARRQPLLREYMAEQYGEKLSTHETVDVEALEAR